MDWTLRNFDSLTPYELYAILRLRSEVFVVEQTCIFLDMDNNDQQCYHLMGWQDDLLYAYALADARNQKSLNEAFPGLEEVYQNSLRWDSIGRGVRVAFPSFTQLHEEIGEPWKVALFPHE